jgi:ATP-dependent exoDNAse (exonuclease V) beta subunit
MIDSQEANLMYVALTRAQKAIAPTQEMAEWFGTQEDTKAMFPPRTQPEESQASPALSPGQEEEQAVPRAA